MLYHLLNFDPTLIINKLYMKQYLKSSYSFYLSKINILRCCVCSLQTETNSNSFLRGYQCINMLHIIDIQVSDHN
jgi:hypothetical protein